VLFPFEIEIRPAKIARHSIPPQLSQVQEKGDAPLVAQYGYAVRHEVCGGRLNVVDAEREVIEAPLSQIRWVRTRIGPWGRVELE
jgi:hypothetical protein